MSAHAIMMVILGGMGNFAGAIAGAFAFEYVLHVFKDLPTVGSVNLGKHWQLWMGLFIVAVVILAPRGLLGLAERFLQRKEAGVNVLLYQSWAFGLAGFCAGIAGGLLAGGIGQLDGRAFSAAASALAAAMPNASVTTVGWMPFSSSVRLWSSRLPHRTTTDVVPSPAGGREGAEGAGEDWSWAGGFFRRGGRKIFG